MTRAEKLIAWDVAAGKRRAQIQRERIAELTGVPVTVDELPGQLGLFDR